MHRIIELLYTRILKPILFRFDPEMVHDGFLRVGHTLGNYRIAKKITRAVFSFENKKLSQTVHGITFTNPIGLAAGFDKDAHLVNILPDIGFGFAEIGSVTARPYEGNPHPRLVRLPKSRGILVNYGLKNNGVDALNNKFVNEYPSPQIPISISVAKTNCKEVVTPEEGIADYVTTLTKLTERGVGNIYTINISCPNTFGGEPFTTPELLEPLLKSIDALSLKKPLWIKMPISVPDTTFSDLCSVADRHNVSGLIIGNLQKDRTDSSIIDHVSAHQAGGISGKPTWKRSNELISQTYATYKDRFVIIGCGGVFSAEDAYEKIKRGATLVQLITGMIYKGPQLIGQINRELIKLAEKDGYTNISEAVGAHSHR